MRAAPLLRVSSAVWCARAAADASSPSAARARGLYGRAIRSAFRYPVELGDLQIDGDDLAQIGIKPGPRVGKVLAALLDRVLENPALNERSRLLEMARELANGEPSDAAPGKGRP